MDYSSIATSIANSITIGLPQFAVVIGLVIGIPLVVRLFKRMAR